MRSRERSPLLHRSSYPAGVDILIMVLLLGLALLIWRGSKRGLILGLWILALVAMVGLFRFHVTSQLDLSF